MDSKRGAAQPRSVPDTHTHTLSLCPLCLHPCLNEKASSTCDASFLEPYLSLTDCFSLRQLLEPLTLCVCCNPREKAGACTAPMHRGAAAMVLGPWTPCYRRFDSSGPFRWGGFALLIRADRQAATVGIAP